MTHHFFRVGFLAGSNVGNLKDAVCKSAKATGARYELIDGGGLYLDVTSNGVRTWRYRYRLAGAREKITIGPYPAVSLAEARARHLELSALVARGKSPLREIERARQRSKDASTVEDLAQIYRKELAARSKGGISRSDWHFSRYIIPTLGRYPLSDITPQDVLALLDPIRETAPASAIAVHGSTKRMFEFAIGRQLLTANPASAIPQRIVGEKKSRTRTLSPSELETLLRHLDSAKGEPETIQAFQLLLLTMVRRNELLEAPWDEFDLESATWTIPASRTKNGKAHVVPLSSQAVAILESRRALFGSLGLVLPGRTPGKGLSTGTLHESMRRNDGFGIARFTPHDFRRTASTILHEQGWNSDVIEKALNHTMKGVRGVYNRAEYLPERRRMLQEWADWLDLIESTGQVDAELPER